MGKPIVPLSEAHVKNAKRKEKDYKLFDGDGLYLVVWSSLGRKKQWRLDYRFQGTRKTISLGSYPETTLAQARKLRQEFKEKINNGINPSEERKEIKAEHNPLFKNIAEKWLLLHKGKITDNTYVRKAGWLKNHIFPILGTKEIKEIKRIDIINLLQSLQSQDIAETADRISNMLNSIWKYAVMLEYVEHNIIADIDKKVILPSRQKKHYPTITDPNEISTLLKAIDNYKGDISTKLALTLSPYVFLRSYNIRALEWKEVDFEKKEIKIPGPKMKMKEPHIVPLTESTIAILKQAYTLSAHCSIYVFPSNLSNLKIMSENTLNQAIRRLGYSKEEMVYHSFRGMASTLMNEKISEHGVHTDAIEVQLAHAERNESKAAYNHAKYIETRRILMQWWSDYLDGLKQNL
ncbi:tyrosine-type recombinase/integrase [Sulfurospirillum cavolei]|uniref:tyrosine-type recombinase/integrase n=1 Tax=Sulfurospirillum cavolei TaxID=366522 RepID=UPI003FA332CE